MAIKSSLFGIIHTSTLIGVNKTEKNNVVNDKEL